MTNSNLKNFIIAGHFEGDSPIIQLHAAENQEAAELLFESSLRELESLDDDADIYIDDVKLLEEMLENPVTFYGNIATTENTHAYVCHVEGEESRLLSVSASLESSIPMLFEKYTENFSNEIHLDATASLKSLLAA